MGTVSRDIYWVPLGDPGCEHLHVDAGAEGVGALGLVLRRKDDQALRCRYQLEADRDWGFRRLVIAVTVGGDESPRRLTLEHGPEGDWRINGVTAPELAECTEIDIEITPFTNTLPIRRLALAAGEAATVTMAYVPVPALEPFASRQRYTCLEPYDAEAGGLYRFESIDHDFTAELPVDEDAFVIDYPQLFQRSWPR